jgi:hypothetical protein
MRCHQSRKEETDRSDPAKGAAIQNITAGLIKVTGPSVYAEETILPPCPLFFDQADDETNLCPNQFKSKRKTEI